jgi:hypothetical protein
MVKHEATSARQRVLLVSEDDTFSAMLKPRLPGLDVLSLPESSVWVATRAGLDVTRGIDAVLLDHQVSGRLQLRMYETLRPSDRPARVTVIFTRSKLTAATAGFDHELDFYQPEGGDPDQTARLVAHALGVPLVPPRVAARMAAPAGSTVASRGRRAAAAIAPGLLQRLGLWGVAAALIGFTFWPLVGSGPVREAMYGPLTYLSGETTQVATSALRTRSDR